MKRVNDPETNSNQKDYQVRTVFAGLMLGMFSAAVATTIIAPAMPRIVAELGGMEHYSWIAVSALLASTVIVPIVGKLSDLYGRKAFYVGGIVLFMISSVVAGFAGSYEMFMVGRVLEGFGMGTMMPLSQTIIADIISPRDRGKYQGLMGSMFGIASIIGPFLGGWLTESLSWRWLFFVNLPLGAVALAFIIPFMRIPHVRRKHVLDIRGFVTLTIGLTSVLLATVWGGVEYPWFSGVIVGLYGVGTVSLVLFFMNEPKVEEPVLPPVFWRNRTVVYTNLAVILMSMTMFGVIYYIPIFVQGILGGGVLNSGAILTPMSLGMVTMSTASGFYVSRTGRYRGVIILGGVLLLLGAIMVATLNRTTPYAWIVFRMAVIGVGLGASMQTFVLVVQNVVDPRDVGVATATTQLFRSIGSSVGIAVLGSVMTLSMRVHLKETLSPEVLADLSRRGIGETDAGAILNPETLAVLSPQVLEGFRSALSSAMHPVFLMLVPFAAVALLAGLMIPEKPLRRTVHPETGETGRHLLDELSVVSE